ncbi:MAG: serine/threonine protein kinase [Polyangiaceae bacterium]|nr:serine/threonine protein kinase [Polyangiaceae bacterium]
MSSGPIEVSPEALERRARERVGAVLSGKWRLVELIGVGGMASVYSAVHRNGSRVAIKILHEHLSKEESVRLRFLQEGYAANRVGHPGAVSVRDDGETADGAAFLVMELLEGQSLEFKLRVAGPISPVKVLDYAEQALDILAAAHERGIVHCDLKPDNVFITTDGVVKILDYGIAIMADGSRRLTQPEGTLMGTPGFMPPEQARARWDQVDARSDIWALGATLFNALSGRTVHDGEGTHDELVRTITDSAPPLAVVNPEVPAVVAALIDRALAFEPEDRWPTARAMQEAVSEARAAIAPSPSAPPPPDSYSASQPPPAREFEDIDTLSQIPVSSRTPPSSRTLASRRVRLLAVGGAGLLVGALVVLIVMLSTGSEPGVAAADQALPGKPGPSVGSASRPAAVSMGPVVVPVVSAASEAALAASGASELEADGSESERRSAARRRSAVRRPSAFRTTTGVGVKRPAVGNKTETGKEVSDDPLSRRK